MADSLASQGYMREDKHLAQKGRESYLKFVRILLMLPVLLYALDPLLLISPHLSSQGARAFMYGKKNPRGVNASDP